MTWRRELRSHEGSEEMDTSVTGRKCVQCIFILNLTLSSQSTVVSVCEKCLKIQMLITLSHHTYVPRYHTLN